MNILQRLQNHDPGIDFSYDLQDDTAWNPGTLNRFLLRNEIAARVTALAVEPLLGLLAVGTSSGKILLSGSPPTFVTLEVPKGVERVMGAAASSGVKFLGFATNGDNVLHVWNLDPQREEATSPILLSSLPFPEPVSAITTSPAHCHLFVALQSGEVMTYDLDRLCPSPYLIPNLWMDHEDVLKRTGVLTDTETSSIPAVMDIVIHPRDVNLLFIAYEGGVILWNLAHRERLHTYHLVLHPGALGGGNYSEEELFTERSPPVTTLSVHPSGHIFAVGHMDGCISFWAVEDDDRPLAVRTLSEPFSFLDVHLPDTMSLIDQQSPDSPGKERKEREPIFKLAWSGFPGVQNPGDYGMSSPTTLTILGGTLPTDLSGVSILSFPKLTLPNPDAAAPPSPSAASSISPTTRQALKTSLFPSETLDEHDFEPRSSFPSTTPIEDFVLIPRNNPYLNGSFDTVGIILLSSADGRSKGVLQAFEFPPQVVHSGALDEHRLARVRLPVMLEFAYPCIDDVVMGASIVKFDKREAFGRLLSGWINGGDKGDTFLGKRIQSNGGSAWSDFDGDNAPDPNLSKYDYPRVMVLFHRDLSVRFYDISSQLLISTSALRYEYPQLLPNLTLEVGRVLSALSPDPSSEAPASGSGTKITSVFLSKTSLECAAVLNTGDVTIWRLRESGSPRQLYEIEPEDATTLVPLEQFVLTVERKKSCFHPFCLIKSPTSVAVSAYALSDFGFLAIGYSDNSLLVVDLRGPRVLFRDLSKDEKDKLGPVNVFNWAICGLGAKPQLSLRLFATHRSGTTRILTFVHDPETQKWDIDPSHHVDGAHSRRDSSSAGPTTIPISSCADPYLSIVLDGKNGQDLTATPSALQKIIDESEADSQSVFSKGSSSTKDTHHKKAHCFWVIVGKKELRCYENIVGNRVGLAEWSKEGGEIVHVKIVNRKGSPVLVAIQTSGKAMIYSLPELEYMRSVDIPSMNPAQESTFDLDPEGDFLQYTTSTPLPSITYGTLFNFRRPLPPHVDFGEPAPPALPAPPQPIPLVPVTVTSGLGAWIWGTAPKVYKGSEIDGILAGLDRPLPRAASPKPSNAKVNSTARRAPKAVNDSHGDVGSRLRAAIGERGETLQQLDETFSALESSSRDLAKRLATQQTAKRWLPGFG